MPRYTHNPEPQPDPPYVPYYGRYGEGSDPHRLHRDHIGDQSTEFSFGPGPVAPHLNGRPPRDGGIYMGRSPRVDPPRNEYRVGRPRIHCRPPDEARGYLGEQVTP
jgi:hypothetical protein